MEVFEMNLKKTPESILGTACKQWRGFKKNPINRELLNTIKQRKTVYLGHILRGSRYELLKLILKGKWKKPRA